jgi:tRNA pseudouridine32 synthase/23S rRNA pseudouridine746 synthase
MLRGLATDPNPVLLQQHDRPDPQVIHEDEHLLVINKPAEYLSVPGKTGARSVLDFARERCPEATGPLIVHRLDMSTSGLMVIAKTTSAYHHLQAQFAAHTVVKRYHALLDGILESNQGVIDLPLRVDLENRPCQLVCYQHGKPARTLWTVLQRRASRTLVAFTPVTGRTHQLRVHAAHQLGLHCPIVGDDLYGTRADRLHLHAQFLQFTHPGTGVVVSFQSTIDF